MTNSKRPIGFWILEGFMAFSVILMLAGQTTAVFDYDFAVRYGLQESDEQVGSYGIQINRAFGASDTVIYIPLLLASLWGVWHKKPWALVTTAAVSGISVYWSVTVTFMFAFLPGSEGYSYTPGIDIWIFVIAFAVFGAWCTWYLISRRNKLFESNSVKGN